MHIYALTKILIETWHYARVHVCIRSCFNDNVFNAPVCMTATMKGNFRVLFAAKEREGVPNDVGVEAPSIEDVPSAA